MGVLRLGITLALALMAFMGPLFVSAQTLSNSQDPASEGFSIVQCGRDGEMKIEECDAGGGMGSGYRVVGECSFCDLIQLASRVLNIFMYASIFVATLMFVYAGILYLTSGPNPNNIGKAHRIFWDVLLGFVFVLAAWLIVDIALKVMARGPGGSAESGLAPWTNITCPSDSGQSPCISKGEQPTETPATEEPPVTGEEEPEESSTMNDADRQKLAADHNLEYNPADVAREAQELEEKCMAQAGGCSLTSDDFNREAGNRALLKAAGIGVNKDSCLASGQSNCTDTRNFNKGTLDYVLGFKKACGAGCDGLVVTGGTETGGGHTCTRSSGSHCSGDKVDFRPSAGLDRHVLSKFSPAGGRSDGAALYTDPDTGAVWAREGDHWDVEAP